MPRYLSPSRFQFSPPPARHRHSGFAGTSDLSIWLSVDLDGRDIWEINEEGRIVSHDATYKEKDKFYRVDNNGNRVESHEKMF